MDTQKYQFLKGVTFSKPSFWVSRFPGCKVDDWICHRVVRFQRFHLPDMDCTLKKHEVRNGEFLAYFFLHKLHPRKLTCPLKRDYFNRKYIFQPLIYRGHVSFPGSTVASRKSACLFLTSNVSKKSMITCLCNWQNKRSSSWWFQPIWKILVRLEIFPK